MELIGISKDYLKKTTPWSKFMAIMGFIGVGMMAICAVSMISMGTVIDSISPIPFPLGMLYIGLGMFYLVMTVAAFFPALYLFRFSQKTCNALETDDTLVLEDAFKNMKCYWKIKSILTIVVVAILLIAIPIIVIAVISSLANVMNGFPM